MALVRSIHIISPISSMDLLQVSGSRRRTAHAKYAHGAEGDEYFLGDVLGRGKGVTTKKRS